MEWFETFKTHRGNLPLTEGSTVGRTYTFTEIIPEDTTASIELYNHRKQLLDTWAGVQQGDHEFYFEVAPDVADLIPDNSLFRLVVDWGGEKPWVPLWGDVTRPQLYFRDNPQNTGEENVVQYRYLFGTPGRLSDPAWRILKGAPWIYEGTPDAVAAGTLLTGEFFPEVFMLYYEPLRTDAVEFTYNVVQDGDGETTIVLCSNYDGSSWAGIRHVQNFGAGSWDDDKLQIVTGTGVDSADITVEAEIEHDTADEMTYKAVYNPVNNTFSAYRGSDLTPLLEWEDVTQKVHHGAGFRSVGLAFKSELLSPGVMISDWIAQDGFVVA